MHIEHVALEADTWGQELSLRIVRFCGDGTGPSVYMQAGLHAHELPGMVALDRLIPRLEAAEMGGRLIGDVTLVPHAKPIGLAQGVLGETLGRFDLNGRVNFNRSFPEVPFEQLEGRPAPERLKALLLERAAAADVVLDLHCDDEGPVYCYVTEAQLAEGRRLAHCIGAAVILTDPGDDVISLDLAVKAQWATEDRGAEARFAATIELRGTLDVSQELAEQDAEGLYRYLVEIGAIHDSLLGKPPVEPIVGSVDDARLLATPVPGALLYHVAVGDWVREGQLLVSVLPVAGAERFELRAPFEGLVMTRRDRRIARRGAEIIKVLQHPCPSVGPRDLSSEGSGAD